MSESVHPESEAGATERGADLVPGLAEEDLTAYATAAAIDALRQYRNQIVHRAQRTTVACGADPAAPGPSAAAEPAWQALDVLRIDIHGSWSVADFINLLGRLDDGYKAAAALESLATPQSGVAALNAGYGSQSARSSADELLQAVTAFRLAGGLRLGSLRYGSPGFVEVIGALNPLKTVKDGITENREINRKRDETRRLDERQREQQAMHHEEAMTRESRMSEQQQQNHALEVARLQLEAESAQFNAMTALIDRLPPEQQTVAAAELLQRLMGATAAIANDARVDGARMIQQGRSPAPPEAILYEIPPQPAMAIAPDGSWLATVDGEAASIWSADGALRATLTGHHGPVLAMAIAPDGNWLATASRDGAASIWSADGTPRVTFGENGERAYAVAIAPDASWLVTASEDGTARIWGADGALRAALTGHLGPVFAVAIAPDGSWLVTAGGDGTARIWSADHALLQSLLTGHDGALNAVAIAPDGSWLVTAGDDGTARIWSADGALQAALTGHHAPVYAVAIAPRRRLAGHRRRRRDRPDLGRRRRAPIGPR
jgi:hypothetical protein